MVGVRVKTKDETAKVRRKARDGSIRSLGHAAGAVRLTARRSIKRSKNAATPGQPPHTRRGQLKNAIAYVVEEQEQRAVVGSEFPGVGPSGMAHEHGGLFRGGRYPKRAFMGPALEKIKPRLPKEWADSIKGD